MKLTADHPYAIACKQAAKKLMDQLYSAYGMEPFTGCGITLSDDGSNAAISLNLKDNSLLNKLPKTFEGYEVHIKVSGEIRAL